jgi:hypothetical protein
LTCSTTIGADVPQIEFVKQNIVAKAMESRPSTSEKQNEKIVTKVLTFKPFFTTKDHHWKILLVLQLLIDYGLKFPKMRFVLIVCLFVCNEE